MTLLLLRLFLLCHQPLMSVLCCPLNANGVGTPTRAKQYSNSIWPSCVACHLHSFVPTVIIGQNENANLPDTSWTFTAKILPPVNVNNESKQLQPSSLFSNLRKKEKRRISWKIFSIKTNTIQLMYMVIHNNKLLKTSNANVFCLFITCYLFFVDFFSFIFNSITSVPYRTER